MLMLKLFFLLPAHRHIVKYTTHKKNWLNVTHRNTFVSFQALNCCIMSAFCPDNHSAVLL